MDIKIGMMAHLVNNKCGNGDEYILNQSNVNDFAKGMTDQQYDKILHKRSEDAIKEQLKQQLETIKQETIKLKDDKEYTKEGHFEVEPVKKEEKKDEK